MPSFKILEADTGLQVTGLRKSYRKKIIIHDISLELERRSGGPLQARMVWENDYFLFHSWPHFIRWSQVKMGGMDVTTMPMYRRARWVYLITPRDLYIQRPEC